MNIEGEITDNPDQIAEVSQRIRKDFIAFAQTVMRDDTGNPIVLAPMQIAWIAHAHYAWERNKGCVINAPMGHGKCLDARTYVNMADGTRKQIQHVHPGDRVISLGDDFRFTEDRVVAAAHTGMKPVIRITTHGHHRIVATREHRVLTFDGWKVAGDLVIGDYMAAPRRLPCGRVGLTESAAVLLALWLANGSKAQNGFTVSTYAPAVIAAGKAAAESRGWTWAPGSGPGMHSVTKSYAHRGDTPMNLLRTHGLRGLSSRSIRIPQAVASAPAHILRAFIGMLWACDGTVCTKAKVLEYSSNSENLVRGIRRLLWRLDIRSNISSRWTTNQSGKRFFSWRLCVSDTRSIAAFRDQIRVLGKEQAVSDLADTVIASRSHSHSTSEIVPAGWRKMLNHTLWWFQKNHNLRVSGGKTVSGNTHRDIVATFAAKEGNTRLRDIATGDVDWVRVTRIEDAGEVPTVDIQTEKHHNFLGGDLVTHNSVLIGVGMPLHALSQDTNIRVKVISATDDLAADRVTGIRSIIDNSPEFRAYCPHVRASKKDREAVSAKKMWARKKFFLQRSGQSLDASVEGYGILSSGVGGRVDLMVLDDPVDEKNSQSEVTRRRVLNQFEKIWMTRLTAKSRWIMISTPYHHDDLNAHLRRNPDVCVLEQAVSEDFGSIDFRVINADTDHPLYALST